MPDLIDVQSDITVKSEYQREDVEFNAEGFLIRGWLYLPKEREEKVPAIIMAHGFGALKEMHLDKYAAVFASQGFAVLVFDYRGFGDSEGILRNEVNPWQQVEDYRHAITFATTLDVIDENNIGVWGTSYSGGHVLTIAATDPRVKCVVSQVPTIRGSESSLRRVPGEKERKLFQEFATDRINRMEGKDPAVKTIASSNEEDNAIYGSLEAVKWYSESGEMSPNWTNEVTLRSVEYSRSYDPGYYISQISPVPLLVIVGTEDHVTPTDLALQAYEHALEPKKLVLIDGGHFDPYIEEFSTSSGEAISWFEKHLMKKVNQNSS